MNEKRSKKSSAGRAPKHSAQKNKKVKSPRVKMFGKVMATVGKVVATLCLVGIITGCIVVTALTVYVMKFADQDDVIDIANYQYNYTTIVYGNDKDGNPVEVETIHGNENREWVDFNDIPQHVKDAFVYTEDKRFYEHEGVDWKRTFAAFANLFLHFYDTEQGGSTITQQTIKVISGDDAKSIQRKVREIFRAINMERKFSKDDILECYLNLIYLGGNAYGVQAASQYFYGKDVQDISVAEAAALAAGVKSPYKRNPKSDPEYNKKRRNNYTLPEMLKAGAITEEEYEKALVEEIKIVSKQSTETDQKPTTDYYSYFTDHIYNQVIADLMEEKGYTKEFAKRQLETAGYRIYTTMDVDLQEHLEKKYKDAKTFYSSTKVKDPPQSAMVVFDYNGQMKAVVGGRGEKSGSLVFNRATQAKIGVGSSIKPLSTYALALDKNLITYSTVMKDEPVIKNVDGTLGPKNFDGKKYGNVTIEHAVRVSMNTIPVKLIKQLTPQASYNFLEDRLGISTLVRSRKVTFEDGSSSIYSDVDLARLAMGSMVDGIKLSELANAYQIFGNGGYFSRMTCYTKVTDANDEVILQPTVAPVQVISSETATVMNKLLQRVVESSDGTGRKAKLSTQTVIGKTGTANDGKNKIFVGMTPYYIGAVWLGYDTPKQIKSNVAYAPPVIWKNVMEDVYKKLPKKEFPYAETVQELEYCTSSGNIANEKCPNKQTGYYKSDNIPPVCTEH